MATEERLEERSEERLEEDLGELAVFEGKISLAKGLPYGLQHVLTMFVANLAPIALICSAAGFSQDVEASSVAEDGFAADAVGYGAGFHAAKP